ncbi:putative nucleotidyltransferase [Pedobacter cryoconitis]|uniref:Putative nucleotidyltransferase n=1 Tax=Pedobacter cryoconitis TaxID=188932 RepID=A0A7W8YXS7_9SPHI|nr:nucleotidyltransferase domain-containing protein [Pedobacter cryoconitis]MBB5623735.1 putative nucleotidyltransferase [Pedobacter cryoconitis]
MAVPLNSYLNELASKYYLKNDSEELRKISNSIESLFKNLNTDLGLRIKRKFIFGSYDRDTILPRTFDSKSDVDIMVVFNHTDYERTPETYRTWLKNFADKYYKDRYGSEVVRSTPTVTIRLNNIKYDLVPAKEITYQYLPNDLYIPNSSQGWQQTDPNSIKNALQEANKKYDYIVKPIIRLIKAWNANVGYPYDSFELELAITKMNFHLDNIQTGFFWAVKYLPVGQYDPQYKKDKVASLQNNIDKVKLYLENNDSITAKYWLHKVLP